MLDIRLLGKVAHSSAPWRGANAIYKMRPIIQFIENLSDRLPEQFLCCVVLVWRLQIFHALLVG